MLRGLGICLITWVMHPAFALGPANFGPEFTFYHPKHKEADHKAVIARMESHLIDHQSEAAKFRKNNIRNGAEFTSPNGWNFTVKEDFGVVEVGMKPGSPELFEAYEADMQDAIFASASNVGYFPALFLGGGHINLSLDVFEDNRLLLRNFIVDWFNHNELSMGMFGYDSHNALPFVLHPRKTIQAIARIIAQFDDGKFKKNPNRFMGAIQEELQMESDPFTAKWGSHGSRHKRFAMNFGKIHEGRIEIRAVRPQANMNVWIRQIKLIRDRLLYLETFTKPLPLNTKVPLMAIDIKEKHHHLNPPIEPQEAFRAFYQYIRESGHRWQDHRDYVWPKWVSHGQLEKFEASDWFQAQESNCNDELARESA